MKRTLFLIFAIIYGFSSVAQNNSEESFNRLKIGIFYSYDNNVGASYFDYNNADGLRIDYDHVNYKVGASFEYPIKNGFTVNSGINYSNKNFTGQFICGTCTIQPHFPYPGFLRLNTNMEFIEVPVSFRKYFLESKTKLFVDLGFLNQFTINNRINLNNYVLSGKIEAGIEYIFSSGFGLMFSTEYDRSISRLRENSNYKLEVLSFKLGIIKQL